MLPRPDLRHAASPAGLEIFQVTTESIPSCHIYMEAQIFAPDSRRFVVHRSSHVHGSDRHDPEHRYLLAEVDPSARAGLLPLTDELGPTGPAISPDGKYFYYFVDRTELNAGSLTLKRVKLDGTGRETLFVLDKPLSGAKARISEIYPLSTISSDSQRIAISGFLGDGRTNFAPWGLVVFDIAKATAELILAGPSWCNVHPQYCRSQDARATHDILVQENHDNVCTPEGKNTTLCGGQSNGCPGADIHVIRDDGTDFRNLPWGRNGTEYCQGHQCWVGRGTTAITTAGHPGQKISAPTAPGRRGPGGGPKPDPAGGMHEEWLVEGPPLPYDGHRGAMTGTSAEVPPWTDGPQRNVLSRDFAHPIFYHFATDIAGRRFVTDADPRPGRGCDLYLAGLGRPMQDALKNWTFLLDTKTDMWGGQHVHPFLSPDGKMAFFNSDESGQLQAYMVRGLPEV